MRACVCVCVRLSVCLSWTFKHGFSSFKFAIFQSKWFLKSLDILCLCDFYDFVLLYKYDSFHLCVCVRVCLWCVCGGSSHHHSEWAKLDRGLGGCFPEKQRGRSVTALAGVWLCHRTGSVLPRWAATDQWGWSSILLCRLPPKSHFSFYRQIHALPSSPLKLSYRKPSDLSLPVVGNPNRSHTLKDFSHSLSSKIILQKPKFPSVDYHHIWLALGALWHVWLKFCFGHCWGHWFALVLALAAKQRGGKALYCMQWAENGLYQ